MASGIEFNPSARIAQTARPVQQNLEERMLIARLFGQQVPATESATPARPTTADQTEKSPLAPNLGQNVDVLA